MKNKQIYGYCEGYFGRDHYWDGYIEAEGRDWVVVREIGGEEVDFVSFDNYEEKLEKIKKWGNPKNSYMKKGNNER